MNKRMAGIEFSLFFFSFFLTQTRSPSPALSPSPSPTSLKKDQHLYSQTEESTYKKKKVTNLFWKKWQKESLLFCERKSKKKKKFVFFVPFWTSLIPQSNKYLSFTPCIAGTTFIPHTAPPNPQGLSAQSGRSLPRAQPASGPAATLPQACPDCLLLS